MKRVFLSIAVALCLLPLASACASQALVDMQVYDEDDMTGVTLDAIQSKDGMLLTGASEYMDSGWVAFLEPGGGVCWSYSAEPSDLFLCPSPLAGGGFSTLLNHY